MKAKTAAELAEVLGFTPADGVEIEFSVELNDKIIDIVKRQSLTHEEPNPILTVPTEFDTSWTQPRVVRVLWDRGHQSQMSATFAPDIGYRISDIRPGYRIRKSSAEIKRARY